MQMKLADRQLKSYYIKKEENQTIQNRFYHIVLKQINKEEIMDKTTLKPSTLTYQHFRPPVIHSKPKCRKASYQILKKQKQNSTPIFSKIQNFVPENHLSAFFFRDSKVKLIQNTKNIQKKMLNDFSIKEKSNENEIKAQAELQKIRVFIEDFTIKNIPASLNKRYIYGLYRGVKYSLQTLKPSFYQYKKYPKIELNQPTIAKDKFLFLDLDQTLIFTEKQNNLALTDKISYKVSIRPYVFTFLQKLSPFYEIYVFTSAVKSYAQAALSKLNKKRVYIKDFLCRDQCIQTKKGRFIKDLRIIKNRQLKDIVIVDNLVQSFCLQLDNGIPILSFDGYTQDQELLKLIPFLQQISSKDDVRPHIRQKFKLQKLATFDKVDFQQILGVKTK